MSSHYQVIYADLMEDEPEAVILLRLPNLDLYDAITKIFIEISYKFRLDNLDKVTVSGSSSIRSA